MKELAQDYVAQGQTEHDALNLAGDVVVSRQIATTAMPRRFTQFARDVWKMQPRLTRLAGKRPQRLAVHPKFRAAYDFLILRGQAGEDVEELVKWWTDFQVEHKDLMESVQVRKPANRSQGHKNRRRPRKPK